MAARPCTSSNSDIASGVADLAAGLDVLQRETGRSKYHVFGESSGAIRAGAFAQAKPDRVDRLMLARLHLQGQRRCRDQTAAGSSSPNCAPARGANATPP